MAHNLKTNEDGKRAMIYNELGGKPWHSLGNPVHGPFTVEVAKQVWPFTYYKEKIKDLAGNIIEGYEAIRISDTKKIMAVGGEGYTIIQPEEVAEFGQKLSDDGMLCETAGALGQGQRLWLLLHTKDYKFEVFKGDEHRMYTLITNAYDLSAALESRYTGIRAVCDNTVTAAVNGSPALIKLRHTSNVKARMGMAAEIFKGYLRTTKDFKEAMQELAKHPINDRLVHEFEVSMFGDLSKTEEGRSQSILKNKLTKFEELMFTGKGTDIKGVVGSAYGMLNAYTEWADWFSTVKGSEGDRATARTNAILFGQASKDKTKALNLALQLVSVR
jgi:phage/plasmid-like protein (TIGR03299 family)